VLGALPLTGRWLGQKLAAVGVSDPVRRAALWPSSDLPDPPAGHPYEQIRREGFTVGVMKGMSFGSVYPEALPADGVEAAREEARSLLAGRGMSRAAWFVPEACTPAGLVERLLGDGMVPFEQPPLEPRFAAMALHEPPPAGPAGVEARPVLDFAEFRAGSRVADDAFQMSEQDRQAFEAKQRVLWDLQSSGRSPYRSFVALVDGEVVGSAGAIFGANAVYLAGGSTRSDMRGQGVYRALVRARWDVAAESGTPALTVSAGSMSRPILERLGFTIVGWADCLLDGFGDPVPAD
jgi:GNAT superfamily N-acetyltransferase